MALIGGTSVPGEGWQEGMNLLVAGKANEAIAVLQQFIQNQPESFEGHNYLGVALAQNKRFDEAITTLQKATKLNAQSAQARFNLGLAFEGANRKESARKEFQSALQLDPKYAAATHAISRLDAETATPMSSQVAGANTPWSSGEASTQQYGVQHQQELERQAKPNVLNILGGFGVGLVASLLCAIIWDKFSYYTGWQFGYAAIGVGYIVGLAVVFGAGKKYGISLQVISALLSLSGILLGQTLMISDYIRDDIAKNPTPMNAGATGIDIFIHSVINLPLFFKESPMSALFALLGLWCGWSAPSQPKEESFPEATATDAPPAPAIIGSGPIDAPPATITSSSLDTPAANTSMDAPPRS